MDGHQTFLAHRPLAQQIFHVLTHSLHQNLEVPCFCVPHFLVQILVMLDCLCQLLVRDPSVAASLKDEDIHINPFGEHHGIRIHGI